MIAFVALTGAAFAQATTIVDPELLPEGRALDQKYRNTLKRLPEPETKHDPWGYVRASGDQKSEKKREAGR
jgi:hypothetical protein